MVWILQNVIKWRNGQVGWVLGGFGGSDGSVWVMGEWSVGQWIVDVRSFQKIFGLYGLKHHIVEISGDVTDAGREKQQAKIDLLSFWSVNRGVSQLYWLQFEVRLTTDLIWMFTLALVNPCSSSGKLGAVVQNLPGIEAEHSHYTRTHRHMVWIFIENLY